MPKIQKLDVQQVAPQALPAPYIRSSGAQQLLRAGGMAAGALRTTAGVLGQMKDDARRKVEGTQELEFTSAMRSAAHDLEWGNDESGTVGYRERLKKDALEGEQQFNVDLQEQLDEELARIPDEEFRENLRLRVSDPFVKSFARSNASWTATQSNAVLNDEWTRNIEGFKSQALAVLARTDRQEVLVDFANVFASTLDNMDVIGDKAGMDPEDVEEQLGKVRSQVLLDGIDYLVKDKRASQAETLFEATREHMLQQDINRIEPILGPARDQEQALLKVAEKMGELPVDTTGNPDPMAITPQQKIAIDNWANELEDADEKAFVREELAIRWGQLSNAKTALQGEQYTRMVEEAKANPNPVAIANDPWFKQVTDLHRRSILAEAGHARAERAGPEFTDWEALIWEYDRVVTGKNPDGTPKWRDSTPAEKANIDITPLLPLIAPSQRSMFINRHNRDIEMEQTATVGKGSNGAHVGTVQARGNDELVKFQKDVLKRRLPKAAKAEFDLVVGDLAAAKMDAENLKSLTNAEQDEVIGQAMGVVFSRNKLQALLGMEGRRLMTGLVQYDVETGKVTDPSTLRVPWDLKPPLGPTAEEKQAAEAYLRATQPTRYPPGKKVSTLKMERLVAQERLPNAGKPLTQFLAATADEVMALPDPDEVEDQQFDKFRERLTLRFRSRYNDEPTDEYIMLQWDAWQKMHEEPDEPEDPENEDPEGAGFTQSQVEGGSGLLMGLGALGKVAAYKAFPGVAYVADQVTSPAKGE